MKYLFVADDQAKGFWSTVLANWQPPQGFERKEFDSLDSNKRQELLAHAGELLLRGNEIFLVTDAQFPFDHPAAFGGSRLARDFLALNPNARALIYSEEPDIRPEDRFLLGRGLGSLKSYKPSVDAKQINIYLTTGNLLLLSDFWSTIRALLVLVPLIEAVIKNNSSNMMDVFRIQPGGHNRTFVLADVVREGFGTLIPPFSRMLARFFDDDLKGALIPSHTDDAWQWLKRALHPDDSIVEACGQTVDFRPPGVLRCFWEIALCGGNLAEMNSDLRPGDEGLAADEKAWVSKKRAELKDHMIMLFNSVIQQESQSCAVRNLLLGTKKELKELGNKMRQANELS